MSIHVIVAFTKEAQEQLVEWYKDRCKYEVIDERAVIREAFYKCSNRVEGLHCPSYEMPSHESKDGHPHSFTFASNDFRYKELQHEDDTYMVEIF